MPAPPDSVRVRVPATTANLGPGFDCLGLALDIYNDVELAATASGVTIEATGKAATDHIPLDERNLVYRAIARVYDAARIKPPGFSLKLTINAPLARGLGSSAAAIVGGMTAANALAGKPLSPDALLREMVAMEGHPDNIVACARGGMTASLSLEDRIQYIKYIPAANMRFVLLIPGYELSTTEARKAIPKSVPLRDAVFNLARMPFVVERLVSGDLSGLSGLMDDHLHQPYRKSLIHGYDIIQTQAEEAGAAAVCLSGAGPTMLAICDENVAGKVSVAMKDSLQSIGESCEAIIARHDNRGAALF